MLKLKIAILTIWIILFSISCDHAENTVVVSSQEGTVHKIEVDADSVILHATLGLVYYHGELFTGTSVEYYSNSNKSVSIDYENGKKHGIHRKWFEDGTKSYEGNYKLGRRHGESYSWWNNGNKRSVSRFENGKANGFQEQWYISGAKFKKMNVVNGKEEGIQQSWRENGKIYNNYEAKNGRIFGLKRATLCYEVKDEQIKIKSK